MARLVVRPLQDDACRALAGSRDDLDLAVRAVACALLGDDVRHATWGASVRALIQRVKSDADPDPYLVLFVGIAAYRLGGEPWRAWSKGHSPVVLRTQRAGSIVCHGGSWDPSPNRHRGRVEVTVLRALLLEIHYRYDSVLGYR